jgi:hypothetical protein
MRRWRTVSSRDRLVVVPHPAGSTLTVKAPIAYNALPGRNIREANG